MESFRRITRLVEIHFKDVLLTRAYGYNEN